MHIKKDTGYIYYFWTLVNNNNSKSDSNSPWCGKVVMTQWCPTSLDNIFRKCVKNGRDVRPNMLTMCSGILNCWVERFAWPVKCDRVPTPGRNAQKICTIPEYTPGDAWWLVHSTTTETKGNLSASVPINHSIYNHCLWIWHASHLCHFHNEWKFFYRHRNPVCPTMTCQEVLF